MTFGKLFLLFLIPPWTAMILTRNLTSDQQLPWVMGSILAIIPYAFFEPHIRFWWQKRQAKLAIKIVKGKAEEFTHRDDFEGLWRENEGKMTGAMRSAGEAGYSLRGVWALLSDKGLLIRGEPSWWYGDKHSDFLPKSWISRSEVGWWQKNDDGKVVIRAFQNKIKQKYFLPTVDVFIELTLPAEVELENWLLEKNKKNSKG